MPAKRRPSPAPRRTPDRSPKDRPLADRAQRTAPPKKGGKAGRKNAGKAKGGATEKDVADGIDRLGQTALAIKEDLRTALQLLQDARPWVGTTAVEPQPGAAEWHHQVGELFAKHGVVVHAPNLEDQEDEDEDGEGDQ